MSHLLLHLPRSSDPSPSSDRRAAPAAAARRSWGSLILIGAVGGVSSGMFAIGGGVLMVPLLVWKWGLDQRHATALALAAVVPSGLVGSLTYLARGQVDLVVAATVSVGAMAGAVAGTRLLQRVPVDRLRWMFVVFILAVAVRLVLVPPVRTGHDVDLSPGVAAGFIALGLAVGVASGLFGIGGGIVAVPLLVSFFAASDLIAKGTSLLVSVPTSAIGTASNHRAGLVDVRTGLILGSVATAVSVPAVFLALATPPRLSGLLLAALLVLVAAQTIAKSRASRRIGDGS